jgi:hypothetical protein
MTCPESTYLTMTATHVFTPPKKPSKRGKLLETVADRYPPAPQIQHSEHRVTFMLLLASLMTVSSSSDLLLDLSVTHIRAASKHGSSISRQWTSNDCLSGMLGVDSQGRFFVIPHKKHCHITLQNMSSKYRYKPRFKGAVASIKGTFQQLWSKSERYLDEELYHCTWNSRMTDDKQSNTESKGVSEYGKTISNHSQHWKRDNDLDGDLYDDITCTKPSRQHQATRMSNKATWLLREPQLEEVINTRLSFVQPSFLVRIFEDYQSTQCVFAIQVRIIGPPYIGCSFVHLSFLDQIFGVSHSAQSVFAIQVRIIGLLSAGVTNSVHFTNKTMEECEIQLPETIAEVNKNINTMLHAPVVLDIGQCVQASNQPSSQALLREVNKPPSLLSVQDSIGTQNASTILWELSCYDRAPHGCYDLQRAQLQFFRVCLLQTFLILLGCSTSLLRLLKHSTSAQDVFEIQVKLFNPTSFGITKSLSLMNEEIKEYEIQVTSSTLFAREDIDKYKIQIPTSMTLLKKTPL